jgi:hypothetical protein
MRYFIVLFSLWSFSGFCQNANNDLAPLEIPKFEIESNEIFFREIMEFQGTQKKLHSIGLKAISEIYRSSKSVIDLNDVENGILIVKGNLPLTIDGAYFIMGSIKPLQISYVVEHTLAIESRENRIRVTIDKFKFISGASSDGESLTFNPPNNLDKGYLDTFIGLSNSENLKKREKANAYNMSLILNELDRRVTGILDQIKDSYQKNLKDDW